jgi:hypothetical protein
LPTTRIIAKARHHAGGAGSNDVGFGGRDPFAHRRFLGARLGGCITLRRGLTIERDGALRRGVGVGLRGFQSLAFDRQSILRGRGRGEQRRRPDHHRCPLPPHGA